MLRGEDRSIGARNPVAGGAAPGLPGQSIPAAEALGIRGTQLRGGVMLKARARHPVAARIAGALDRCEMRTFSVPYPTRTSRADIAKNPVVEHRRVFIGAECQVHV